MSKPSRGGLGKGLGALLPAAQGTAARDKVHELDISAIQANRYQPRSDFQEEALEDLKESIQQYGVLQPVLVRHLPSGGYELIAGERRFRAAKLAGLKTVPAILREYSDMEISEIALIENLQRENLNPVEEARAYDRLLADYGLTQELLSRKVGRSRSHIANFLRLLKLPQRIQEYLTEGSLTMDRRSRCCRLRRKSCSWRLQSISWRRSCRPGRPRPWSSVCCATRSIFPSRRRLRKSRHRNVRSSLLKPRIA